MSLLAKKLFHVTFSIFMIGLLLHHFIDPITCSSLEIGKTNEQSAVPPVPDLGAANHFDENSFNTLDYTSVSAQNSIGQLSPLGKKGAQKSVAMDKVSPHSPFDCGTGLKVMKDTQDETSFINVRSSDSDVLDAEDQLEMDFTEEENVDSNSPPSSSFSLTRIKAGNQSIVPWQVYIREKGSSTPVCGGSILNPTWILTAQHCELTKHHEVHYGSTAPSSVDIGYQIKNVINRPFYKEENHDNDFTLLELVKPIKFSPSVHAVCIPESNQVYDEMLAMASGWGHSKSPQGPFPNKLLTAHMSIKSKDACNNYFKSINAYNLTPSQICAFTTNESKLCQGDSGGPLVVKTTRNRYIQVGVVSAAYSSCGKPIIFGEVSNQDVNDWIINNAFK